MALAILFAPAHRWVEARVRWKVTKRSAPFTRPSLVLQGDRAACASAMSRLPRYSGNGSIEKTQPRGGDFRALDRIDRRPAFDVTLLAASQEATVPIAPGRIQLAMRRRGERHEAELSCGLGGGSPCERLARWLSTGLASRVGEVPLRQGRGFTPERLLPRKHEQEKRD